MALFNFNSYKNIGVLCGYVNIIKSKEQLAEYLSCAYLYSIKPETIKINPIAEDLKDCFDRQTGWYVHNVSILVPFDVCDENGHPIYDDIGILSEPLNE